MKTFPSLWRHENQDPFRTLQREMNALLNQLSVLNWDEVTFPPMHSTSPNNFVPACDLEEVDSHYLLSMDLPGMNKNDIQIECKENQLRVYGERKEEKQETKKSFCRSERTQGSFERMIAFPHDVKADQIEATFDNGVLRVAIPKAETTQVKQIPVGEGKTGFLSKLLGKKETPGQAEKPASPPGVQKKVA